MSSWREYLDGVLEAGTAPNGVFATKLMWGYVDDVLFELRRLSGSYEEGDLAVLRAFFPSRASSGSGGRTVWRRPSRGPRRCRRGQWASFQPVQAKPAFDFGQIDDLCHVARVHDGAWARWFAAQGVEPIRVVYEELAADPAAVVADVLARLGLDPSPGARPDPPQELSRQADGVNLDWAARYRRLAGL